MLSWVNGKPTEVVEILNRGINYGDGLFETIAVERGRCLLWRAHWQRLRRGLAVLRLRCNQRRLITEIAQALKYAPEHAVLKVSIVRGTGKSRGYQPDRYATSLRILQLTPWQPNTADTVLQACRTPLSHQGVLTGLKTLNALEYVIASAELKPNSEGVLCDTEGYLVEGTRSNLFWVDAEGILNTPDLTYCGIHGVVRQVLLNRCRRAGIIVKTRRAKLDILPLAREVFITNSIIGIQSVHRYENTVIPECRVAQTIRTLFMGDIFTRD